MRVEEIHILCEKRTFKSIGSNGWLEGYTFRIVDAQCVESDVGNILLAFCFFSCFLHWKRDESNLPNSHMCLCMCVEKGKEKVGEHLYELGIGTILSPNNLQIFYVISGNHFFIPRLLSTLQVRLYYSTD